jgi:hypothetical protein
MKKSLTPITVSPSRIRAGTQRGHEMDARDFDDPLQQRFQGEGPGPAQRRAAAPGGPPGCITISAIANRGWQSGALAELRR